MRKRNADINVPPYQQIPAGEQQFLVAIPKPWS